MKRVLCVWILMWVCSGVAGAQTPYLVDPSSGAYLGDLSANRFDENSIANPFGRYGSRFSQESVNNPLGPYGDRFSSTSARNPFATNPPVVITPSTPPLSPLDLGSGNGFVGAPLLEW